jgi:simple sugar transport system permease protein
VSIPALPVVWASWAIATALAVVSFVAARRYRPVGLWLPIVYAVLAMVAFLTWAGAGASGAITLVGLLGGSISLAVPLVFGALGGVIGERVGVVNVAIEGSSCSARSRRPSFQHHAEPVRRALGAMLGGVVVAFVLAAFAIKYLVDQVIVGVVLNVLRVRPHRLPVRRMLAPNAQTLNSPRGSTSSRSRSSATSPSSARCCSTRPSSST